MEGCVLFLLADLITILTYAGIAVGATLLWLMPLRAPGLSALLWSLVITLGSLTLMDMFHAHVWLEPALYDVLRRGLGRGVLSLGALWFLLACLRTRRDPNNGDWETRADGVE